MSSSNGHLKELTLADFKNRTPRRLEKVSVPDLGGYAYLQSLYGDEIESWEEARIEKRGTNVRFNAESTRASLLVLTLVSADGRPLGFSEEDVSNLAKQDGRALNQLFEKSCEMNGLRPSDVEALNRPPLQKTHAVSSGEKSPTATGT